MEKNKKPVKEKVYPCRFNYPFETFGCKKEADEDGQLTRIYVRLDEEGNLEVDGSIHTGDELLLLRNHQDLNNHIPEILVIWNANCDQKTIISYDQVLKYLLKYILKAEKRSDFYTNIRKFISTKIDDDTEMKKTFQRILLRNVGERDMPVNEAMLIAQDQPYVEMSGTPRIVDLRGNRKIKDAK